MISSISIIFAGTSDLTVILGHCYPFHCRHFDPKTYCSLSYSRSNDTIRQNNSSNYNGVYYGYHCFSLYCYSIQAKEILNRLPNSGQVPAYIRSQLGAKPLKKHSCRVEILHPLTFALSYRSFLLWSEGLCSLTQETSRVKLLTRPTFWGGQSPQNLIRASRSGATSFSTDRCTHSWSVDRLVKTSLTSSAYTYTEALTSVYPSNLQRQICRSGALCRVT